jgi:hypothetical protein
VTWVRKPVLLLLLALWLPVTLHCRLETISGLSFLVCCQHAGSAPHQDSDCEEDGCAAVESGGYKLEENPSFEVPCLAFVAVLVFPAAADDTPAREPRVAVAALTASELSQGWQFSFRAALPPRAPSFVS